MYWSTYLSRRNMFIGKRKFLTSLSWGMGECHDFDTRWYQVQRHLRCVLTLVYNRVTDKNDDFQSCHITAMGNKLFATQSSRAFNSVLVRDNNTVMISIPLFRTWVCSGRLTPVSLVANKGCAKNRRQSTRTRCYLVSSQCIFCLLGSANH